MHSLTLTLTQRLPLRSADSACRQLPVPGPVWGAYPQRPDNAYTATGLGTARGVADRLRQTPLLRGASAHCAAWARQVPAQTAAWQALDGAARLATLQHLRQQMRHRGLQPPLVAQALGLVALLAARVLGHSPRQTQHMAAMALLDNRMAEMATGEGKTLAVGMAAAVAALAGVPVHVVTANDYLAGRDAQQMRPLYSALGLRVAALVESQGDDDRRAVYGHDVVYATAKSLAFDHLRDRQGTLALQASAHLAATLAARLGALADTATPTPPAAPLMRGLCMALIDEADSVLLDEAEMPLILSRAAPQAARRAFLWQAMTLARQLSAGLHFQAHPADHRVSLTPLGEQQLVQLSSALAGPWSRPRYRREAVTLALAALHVYQRDTHYLVRHDEVVLLDEVTGRAAVGRVWSRGLHTLVALKEGLRPAAETETLIQTTFQRFFQRYWRLAGISGTLWEARAELQAVYGTPTLRIPLHQLSRCKKGPPRQFADAAALWQAVASRVATLQGQGRPVLVGTDSVADSLQLSALLSQRGVAHQVLNALNDADEAAVVAAAGRAACVTVATRLAGRGTDITLDDRARAAGGLHVINCQHNTSRRLDRQLAGRAARHGEPGSTEAWRFRSSSVPQAGAALPILPAWNLSFVAKAWRWLSPWAHRAMQHREERRRAVLRRKLLQQDLDWERRLAFAGLPR